jgi:hypothetical protein
MTYFSASAAAGHANAYRGWAVRDKVPSMAFDPDLAAMIGSPVHGWLSSGTGRRCATVAGRGPRRTSLDRPQGWSCPEARRAPRGVNQVEQPVVKLPPEHDKLVLISYQAPTSIRTRTPPASYGRRGVRMADVSRGYPDPGSWVRSCCSAFTSAHCGWSRSTATGRSPLPGGMSSSSRSGSWPSADVGGRKTPFPQHDLYWDYCLGQDAALMMAREG